jgi:hypothetical protein
MGKRLAMSKPTKVDDGYCLAQSIVQVPAAHYIFDFKRLDYKIRSKRQRVKKNTSYPNIQNIGILEE